jgi:hypothetical protein
VIESLRRSESRLLAFFAACTFGIGFVVGMMVQVFHHETAALALNTGQAIPDFSRATLEMNAAAAASRVAVVSILLWLLSFVVLALALINDGRGSDLGVIRLLARTLYVLSFIAVVAAVSAAIFFMMFHW